MRESCTLPWKCICKREFVISKRFLLCVLCNLKIEQMRAVLISNFVCKRSHFLVLLVAGDTIMCHVSHRKLLDFYRVGMWTEESEHERENRRRNSESTKSLSDIAIICTHTSVCLIELGFTVSVIETTSASCHENVCYTFCQVVTRFPKCLQLTSIGIKISIGQQLKINLRKCRLQKGQFKKISKKIIRC